MNVVFFALILIAFSVAAWRQWQWSGSGDTAAPMQVLTEGIIESAKSSVSLALGLVGVMALFLGLMKVAESGGLLNMIARLLRPVMTRLFPDVPADHPAMGSMIMNMSANVMGLGNAATPFGIRAMQQLETLNPHPGTASNAMVLFLAINTSSVTLLPTGVIALRASAGSADPAGIVPTTLFATLCSTAVAIIVAKSLQRFFRADPTRMVDLEQSAEEARVDDAELPLAEESGAYPDWVCFTALAGLLALVPLAVIFGQVIGVWLVPVLVLGLLSFGVARRVRIYEVFVEGAKDGFQVAIKIIPYLVAILVAVGMLRHSGAMEAFVGLVGGVTAAIGLPGDALPMALLRPLSGSGAYGVVAATIQDPSIGPDSYVGYLVSTLQGSTETTFYVLAVYFGAVQVRRVRHALATGVIADIAGVTGAIIACSYLYGHLVG
jgi:spore maturation protein SpmA